jgi:hypothetical protein
MAEFIIEDKKIAPITKNWIVRYFDKRGHQIGSAIIKDRTKAEAEEEVIMYMPLDCEDWTLVENK